MKNDITTDWIKQQAIRYKTVHTHNAQHNFLILLLIGLHCQQRPETWWKLVGRLCMWLVLNQQGLELTIKYKEGCIIQNDGDCKVKFNQPFYWLYSVPNLLVFQHLVTLYLGGFDVRVVSEIQWSLLKSVQENRDSRLGLTGYSRLQAARRSTRAKHAGRWTVMLAGALQDKTGQLSIRLSRD